MLHRNLAHRTSTQPKSRLYQMANHLTNGFANGATESEGQGSSLGNIPKSSNFTSNLPADQAYPTPADSHKAAREELGPRLVRNALFTYVRPEKVAEPELVGVSPRAMRDIGLKQGEENTETFKKILSGNKILTWNEEKNEGIYPWAQCYGGKQQPSSNFLLLVDPY